MKYKNLIIIGSSHVAQESIDLVRKTMELTNPGIIALELDRDRFYSLLQKTKKARWIRGVGIKGMLFALIGAWIEKKIGKIVNVEPGAEMKMAIELAKQNKIKIALIDQHISITLKRFSQSITWKEKFRFAADLIIGLFKPIKELQGLTLKKEDLTKVPSKDVIKKILNYTKKRYPNFHAVLIDERNKVMANNLASIMKQYPKENIVAVVGAGHEEEIIKLIKEKLYKAEKN